ncbi:MAG: alpha-E domain-containing protein [Phycisphaera sp.]|nr:alpha-E domain-containing protein [Phycisphaera sp.]
MLSRVANAVYWIGRYIERAENVARFVDVNLQLMLDQADNGDGQWAPLVAITGDDKVFKERYGEPTEAKVRQFLTFDPDNPNSIASCMYRARENARSVREVISSEMWEQVNTTYLRVKDLGAREWEEDDPHGFYNAVKMASHMFAGIADSTMSHNEAWHFLRMGRLLERADKTSRIVDVKYFILLPRLEDVGTPIDTLQWLALLKSISAMEMYRKRYPRVTPNGVVEFLLLDRQFPRSLRYCLSRAETSMHQITGSPHGTFSNAAEQGLGRLVADFDYTRIDEVVTTGLHEYLDQFQVRLNKVGDAIYETYFALRPAGAVPVGFHG